VSRIRDFFKKATTQKGEVQIKDVILESMILARALISDFAEAIPAPPASSQS
jgi:hypothetical protein